MTHRQGCLYDTHFDLPVLSTTSQNGGPTFAMYSLSHKLGLIFYPYAVNPVAHWRGATSNGERPIGQYQSGGILAIDAATNTVRWTTPQPTDMGHNQSPLSTASDLVFVGMVDGYFLALDAHRPARNCGASRPERPSTPVPITYEIDGEQYVAVLVRGRPWRLSVRRFAAPRGLALGIQAWRDLPHRIGQQRGPDAVARHHSPAGRRRTRGGLHGEQHDLAGAELADIGHGRRRGPRELERDEPDVPARALSGRR